MTEATCLINHAPRPPREATPAARPDPCPNSAVPADGDGMGTNSLVPRAPTKVYGDDGTFLGISLGRVERMRPDLLEPIKKQPDAVEASESEAPDCVTPYVELLQRRHGVSTDAATVIALAALSAAVGPSRVVRNPLGGTVSAALNVIITDDTGVSIQRAARQALRPFLRQVEERIAVHQLKGPKAFRQLHMELEQECARAIERLHSPPVKPPEPLTIPKTREERRKEALPEMIEAGKQVANQTRLLAFEERPFILTDGLSAADIALIPQRSFDNGLLNFSPDGGALRSLETRRVEDRQKLLRYLVAAWHGNSFVAGAQTILRPAMTNLWLSSPEAAKRLWRNAAIAASGLPETFLMVANEPADEVDTDAFAPTDADRNWWTLLEATLGERLGGLTSEHRLSGAATKRFLEYCVPSPRHGNSDARKHAAWWPEQLLKITLLLHLSLQRQEVPDEIDVATLEAAVIVTERLGTALLHQVESSAAALDNLELEIEVMVTKARLHTGPLTKRGLSHKYNDQRYERLEPILARCCEQGRLRLEDGLIVPVLPG